MNIDREIEIMEVCPRDGWQNYKKPIPTDVKIEYIKKMIDCGAKAIEVTSFVSHKAVPQMADAVEVIKGIKEYAKENNVEIIGLSLNKRGADNAIEAGVDTVEFVLSASEEHNKRNSNKTIEKSLEEFIEMAKDIKDVKINLGIACVFGSPFGDEVSIKRVINMCEEALKLGVSCIGLADTAGISNPAHTREVLREIKEHIPVEKLEVHLHDTRGMGLANAYVALEEGITKLDSSLGAMGGCPFVPGAKGNIGTEDLLNMVQSIGYKTSYDLDKTIKTSIEMGQAIGCEIASTMGHLTCENTGK